MNAILCQFKLSWQNRSDLIPAGVLQDIIQLQLNQKTPVECRYMYMVHLLPMEKALYAFCVVL